MNPQHQKEKVHFQIERIAFFSDAVIAIAATLLIIEIKAPKLEHGTGFEEQLHQLKHLIPEFISFIISFSIILAQWIRHHELFGSVVNYDKKLIAINSIFLFAIAIIPFSTSYFAHNNSLEFLLPYIVYGCSLFFMTLLNYILFIHIIDEKNKLYDNSLTKAQLKWIGLEYLLFPVAILVGFIMSLISYTLGFIAYAAVVSFGFYVNKQKKKVSAKL